MEKEYSNCIVYNLENQVSVIGFLNDSSGVIGYGVWNYFVQPDAPVGFGQHARWLNTSSNLLFVTSDSGKTWRREYSIYIGKLTKATSASNITHIEQPQSVELLKKNDLDDMSILSTASISKSSNGYVKLNNGILIQWGVLTAAGNATGATFTFPTAFTSTKYCVAVNPTQNTSEQNCVMGKTTSSVRINSHGHGGSEFYNNNNVNIIAVGY